jgi:FtsH-binding integral membrane protein
MTNPREWNTRFLAAAWLFVAFNLVGTIVGWLAALPASNGRHGNVHHVGRQAVTGNGTALSPPLFITVILGLCVLAAARSGGWPGRIGAALTFLFAGFYVSAGELGELTTNTSPLTGAKWDLVLALGALGIAIAALTLVTGLRTLAGSLSRRARAEAASGRHPH